MMGITDGRKQLDFTQTVICGVCGKYGRYQVFMTYTVLSLFFYPMLQMEPALLCADELLQYALYELDPEMGKAIARGEQVEILPQHLTLVNQEAVDTVIGAAATAGMRQQKIFEFCPKCGNRFSRD